MTDQLTDSVAGETHQRGHVDTSWWSSGKDILPKRLAQMLAASVVFHAFLTPGPALLGLVAMLPALEIPQDEDLIPVELTTLPLGATAPEPAPKPPEATETEPEVEEQPPAPVVPDEPETPKADPLPEPEKEPEAPAPATEPESVPVPVSRPYGDPVALAGDAGQIADPNANVRLMLYAEVIRNHPIGPQVGALMRRTPQWSDFFGPSEIDPIRDVDRVMIAGPQLRNSSEVVAVVQHRLSKDRIDAAFEALVARKGEWIDREARLAKARADRAPRLFAAPNDKVVIVAPPQLEKQVRKLGSEATFPPNDGKVAMTAYVVDPANAAKGTGLALPKTFKWLRVDLRPTADGGGVLQLLIQDVDEAEAGQNAQLVEALLSQVTLIEAAKKPKSGGLFGVIDSMVSNMTKVRVKSLKIRAQGAQIEGTVEFTGEQLAALAGMVNLILPPEKQSGSETRGAHPEKSTSPHPSRLPDPGRPEPSLPEQEQTAPPKASPEPSPESPAPPQP